MPKKLDKMSEDCFKCKHVFLAGPEVFCSVGGGDNFYKINNKAIDIMIEKCPSFEPNGNETKR